MKTVVTVTLAVLLTFICITFAQAEVLAMWLFDEGQGNIAQDSSGNGVDGKINGAKYVAGKFGTALSFDGESFVDLGVPDVFKNGIEQAFTAETWVKVTKAPPADHSTLILIQTGGPIAMGFTSSTGGGFYGYAGGGSKITDPDKFPVGEWVHVAQTYDGENQLLYQNGKEIARQVAIDAVTHTDDAWTIGAWSTQDQWFLENATLDEMRVLNEALPPEELGFFNSFFAVEPADKLAATWGSIKTGN